MNIRLGTILAAEDEETDRFILNLAFERAKLSHALVIVHDGRQCVDYLSGLAPYDDRTLYARAAAARPENAAPGWI